ncbi:MAG TPA: GNAT family protein [Methylomirabilota bacterium]
MFLPFGPGVIRDWRLSDAPSLARHANNPRVWANLRDRFPSPYTIADAEAWVRHSERATPATDFAIVVGGEAVGGIGVVLQQDVERTGAETGFWLGESWWGRGIMTAALSAFAPWALDHYRLTRLYAYVFEYNAASARVLEKAGFVREARLRKAAIKQGRVIDQFLYAKVREGE